MYAAVQGVDIKTSNIILANHDLRSSADYAPCAVFWLLCSVLGEQIHGVVFAYDSTSKMLVLEQLVGHADGKVQRLTRTWHSE
eukprot:1142036-Pleurochrysis_carterae.AAC.1